MGLNNFTLLAGICLVAVGAMGSIAPCLWCIGFWLSNAVLLALFVKDKTEPSLARMAQYSFFLTLLSLSALMVTHARATLVPIIYKYPIENGMPVGSQLPAIADFKTGYVLIVTDCSLCNQGVSEALLEYFIDNNMIFHILAHKDAKKLTVGNDQVTYITENDFRRLRLSPTGAPHVFEIQDGRILDSRTGQNMLRALRASIGDNNE